MVGYGVGVEIMVMAKKITAHSSVLSGVMEVRTDE